MLVRNKKRYQTKRARFFSFQTKSKNVVDIRHFDKKDAYGQLHFFMCADDTIEVLGRPLESVIL